MKTKHNLIALGLFLSLSLPQAFATNSCERNIHCDELNDLSLACSEKWDQPTCDKFTNAFEKLLVPQVCNEPTKKIRWAMNSCEWKHGNMPIDLHFDRLARLPYAKALKLYTSEKLRKTMDGAVADAHFKKSQEDQNRLGKTLHPSKFIPDCQKFEDIDFIEVTKDLRLKGKDAPQYTYQEGSVGEYILWMGDVPKKIINNKKKKECEVKTPGLLDKITKAPLGDVVRYEMYTGDGKRWETLVDMKTCKPIWEATWDAEDTVSGESSKKITVDSVQNSAWRKCAPCWNKNHSGCLRIL